MQEYYNLVAQRNELNEKIKLMEEEIISTFALPENDAFSKTINDSGYKLTFTKRVNRTIDSEKLKDLARENGISDSLGIIFSWKPTVVAKEWKKIKEKYQGILAQAFTENVGKTSIKIEKIGEN